MMAQRKDMMRIIRQDAGFSAKLGFGGTAGVRNIADRAIPVPPTSVEAVAEPKSESLAVDTIARPGGSADDCVERRIGTQQQGRDGKVAATPEVTWNAKPHDAANGSTSRGRVVYVAVSLTSR